MVFVDRVVEHPNRITLTNVSGDTYDMTRAEGTVTEEGTALTADNLNSIIQEMIDNSLATLNGAITVDANNNVNYKNLQSGRVLVKPAAAKVVTSVTVNFPTPFTKTPNVVVSANTSGANIVATSVGSITTTGFTLYFYRTTKVNTSCHWIAHV